MATGNSPVAKTLLFPDGSSSARVFDVYPGNLPSHNRRTLLPMQVNDNQLQNGLTQVRTLLDSLQPGPDSSEDGIWKPRFAQLITLVHSLLLQAEQAGKRVSFFDGVGVHGKIQDVTSLVNWMYDRLPELTADKPGQWAANRLNRYANQGWGYFANGSFFTVEFDDELGFFIDDQRIYLNHHIRRALAEVEQAAVEQATV